MTADAHRGWLIEQNWLGQWEATHPDFDPTPMHLYDPPGDNRYVTACSREEVIEEIDFWILENEPAGPLTPADASQASGLNNPSGSAIEAGAAGQQEKVDG